MGGRPVLLVLQGPHYPDANGVILLALGQIVADYDEQNAKEDQDQGVNVQQFNFQCRRRSGAAERS